MKIHRRDITGVGQQAKKIKKSFKKLLTKETMYDIL